MPSSRADGTTKVPEVTLVFWLIKIAATTLGETAGDAVSMSMNLGYLISTGIFALLLLAAVGLQIRAPRFHPVLYWLTIIATTTVGTTLADFADRSRPARGRRRRLLLVPDLAHGAVLGGLRPLPPLGGCRRRLPRRAQGG